MNSKLKILWILIIVILVGIFIYLKIKPYNYKTNYVVNKFKISEEYKINERAYTIYIDYNNITYPYIINSKYLKKREIIKKIEYSTTEDNETCILPISDYIDFYPLCSKNNIVYTFNISDIDNFNYSYKDIENSKIEHEKLIINYLNGANYLLYNYKGFYFIKNNEINNITLFNKDIYTLDLIYQLNEYLIIPDYNDSYYFSKFFIINMFDGKLEEIKLDNEISFDSIFLGDYKNMIYLLDRKEEKEYKINLKKKKVEESDFVILINNKLEKCDYKEIINKNLKFDNKENKYFDIKDGKLYQIINNNEVLISNMEVNKIINIDLDTIYYLSNENLYMYNNLYGEILLISNFEWNFNKTNMIYLYK